MHRRHCGVYCVKKKWLSWLIETITKSHLALVIVFFFLLKCHQFCLEPDQYIGLVEKQIGEFILDHREGYCFSAMLSFNSVKVHHLSLCFKCWITAFEGSFWKMCLYWSPCGLFLMPQYWYRLQKEVISVKPYFCLQWSWILSLSDWGPL